MSDDRTMKDVRKEPVMTKRYVVTAKWGDGSTEQVDVDATSAAQARRDAEAELRRDYEPGWMVVAVSGPMAGLY